MRMFSLALAAGLAVYVSGADATAACRAGPELLVRGSVRYVG